MQVASTSHRALFVNGEPVETSARTVAELLVQLGFEECQVATALNGAFVPRQARGCTALSDRDRIEILAPRQGG
jgi:sulfur carrier protein